MTPHDVPFYSTKNSHQLVSLVPSINTTQFISAGQGLRRRRGSVNSGAALRILYLYTSRIPKWKNHSLDKDKGKPGLDMAFSFSFAGDDIEEDNQLPAPSPTTANVTAAGPTASTAGAFPVQGKPLLPPTHHDLEDILSRLPSKIAFSLLDVVLADGRTLQLPRRELWDVRVQLMAEDSTDNPSESEAGLGEHDVKTGIYEGGFKSWESSVDLVKVLASERVADDLSRNPCALIEVC